MTRRLPHGLSSVFDYDALMNGNTQTNVRDDRDVTSIANPLFGKLPEQYYGYALQWCEYTRWTVEEAANLLLGCVPHREMFLKGKVHQALDAEVLKIENKIRAALDTRLTRVEIKRYFSRTYIENSNIIEWAIAQDIAVPQALIDAFRKVHQQRQTHGYTTPAVAAIHWVLEGFWEQADLRDPPKRGEILRALLREFPNLEPQEYEMIEYLARHPAARANPDK